MICGSGCDSGEVCVDFGVLYRGMIASRDNKGCVEVSCGYPTCEHRPSPVPLSRE